MPKPPSQKKFSKTAENELAQEFIRSFHEQFAANQNHHRSVFIQVIVILVPLISGYGYLLLEAMEPARDRSHFFLFLGYLAVATLILSLQIAVLLIMSVSYRRDQYVAAKMRAMVGVLDPDSNRNFFPGDFLPTRRTGVCDWVPDFNLAFLIALALLKLLLIAGAFLHPHAAFSGAGVVILTMLAISIALDTLLFSGFRSKWLRYLRNREETSR